MSELMSVSIGSIDSNPYRQLDQYPYVERKLDTLIRSYAVVGMWEGVIARQNGNRYEIAFGHHRVEAARRAGLPEVSLIVRSLTDEQMLQFMGRENIEDYNADFLCMLETWEAAVVFMESSGHVRGKWQAIDIARLLGWADAHANGGEVLNLTATACNAAYALIQGGYLARENLRDLAVKTVKEITQHCQSRMKQIEEMAKQTQRPASEVDEAKEHLAEAAKSTAEELREGNIAVTDTRASIDVTAYQFAKEAERPGPLFELFGKNLADRIAKMLKGDASERQLEEIRKVLDEVTLDEDKRIIARLGFELSELGERVEIWKKRLIPTNRKVSRLQIAKGEK